MDGAPADSPLAAAAVPPQKRDEWTEGGIARLLEAYEAKWLLRNRAKLKWSDWVDIAAEVSAHCAQDANKPGSSAKTPNQCKNKVESMKKRYRAESAAAARASSGSPGTSWRFFARMDGLLKGPPAAAAAAAGSNQAPTNSVIDLRQAPAKAEAEVEPDLLLAAAGPAAAAFSGLIMNVDANGGSVPVPEKAAAAEKVVDSSAPPKESSDANASSPRANDQDDAEEEAEDKGWDPPTGRKRKSAELAIAKSIELLASSFLKVERARMEMYRETERMRIEAEVKKGEMELKRTEIMAKTHLQIAKLFAKRLKEGGARTGGSSSVTAEVDTLTKKGENG